MRFHDKFQRWARAAVMGCLALSSVAMPAHAGSLWAFGITGQISGFGFQPSISNTDAFYNSSDAAPFGIEGAGLTFTTNAADGSGKVTTSPGSLPAGLSNAGLSVDAEGSNASVSGGLDTGATHMSALTTYGATSDSTAFLEAIMQDQLTFHVGGNGSATINFGLDLDGGVTLPGVASYLQAIDFTLGGLGAQYQLSWLAGSGAGQGPNPTATGWNPGSGFSNDTITGFDFQGSLTVTDGQVLDLYYQQSINCNDGATCSFENTSQMSLILPSDVTYSSASGVFLTADQSQGTPEPVSLVLVGLGIAGIGCVRRRRVR